jgi:hypothetical protein
MTGRTRWLRGVALAVALATVVLAGRQLVRSGAGADNGTGRDPVLAQLAELREAVAGCQGEVEVEQARFQAQVARVDSLRAAVLEYESEERTVPAAEFEAYLEVFDEYNRSVAAWHDRATALQATWDACRALTERHNALADSLSGRPPSLPPEGRPVPSTGPPLPVNPRRGVTAGRVGRG